MAKVTDKPIDPEGIGLAGEGTDQDQAIESLGQILKSRFGDYKDSRSDVEGEWVEDLRSFMGQYDSETLSKISSKGDRSTVYVGLTRTKVLAAFSRMTDLLFQPGQNFFSIEPTPIVKQPILEQELTEQAAMEIMEAANTIDPMLVDDIIQKRLAELKEELDEEAGKRVDAMSEVIKDQAVENNLEGKMKDAIMEQVLFGTGAMKAGTLKIDRNHRWIKEGDGFALVYDESPMPEMEAVSIFDLYPDPFATSVEDMQAIFRRHIITRPQLNDIKDYPGFNADLVLSLIHI